MTRDDVVDEARSWLGTPFVHQAALKGVGCDCIGLVSGVALALGSPEAAAWRTDPEFRGYGRQPLPALLLAAAAKYLDAIAMHDAGPGDVLLFAFVGLPMHFGIVTETGPVYVVHGYQAAGRVVENVVDEKWRRRIVGAYRYRGLA